MKQTHLLVGEIVRPQGIRGEVKLRHFTDDPYRFEELDAVLRQTEDGFEPLTVEACRVQGDDVYLKLEGFDDRNAAETLRGAMLYVDREHAAAKRNAGKRRRTSCTNRRSPWCGIPSI